MSKIGNALSLLFYLNENYSTNRYIKTAEIAEYLEVTPRQVRRYIEELSSDVPITTKKGEYGGCKLTKKLSENFFLPDSVALATYISMKRNKDVEIVLNSISKNIYIENIDGDNIISDRLIKVIEKLLEAITDYKTIKFIYNKYKQKEKSEFIVEPYKIYITNHTYYLYCNHNGSLKKFDSNYIENIELLNEFKFDSKMQSQLEELKQYYGLGDKEEIILKVKCFNNETLEKFDKYYEYKGKKK